MTPKRAAAYIGGASLMAAWLSSAAGVVWQEPDASVDQPRPVQTAGTEMLAADVQAQAIRLRERLASAPAPLEPLRNPFAFAVREPRRVRGTTSPVAPPPATAPPVLAEPPLELLGIAEDQKPEGRVRTAILSADGSDIVMVTEGQVIGGRYRVAAIGADVVELLDLTTLGVRRLALR